ncbi:putative lipoprotein [Devosia lucknowensis]|uniref:Putative lipoprotein n=1 Tax=Devosia lucknowensis TaxID=1096929 RepID=A0A1Y6FGU7_9HYPH|nr:META domain-containing protein [Devosia lucknowensis]SMQ72102.1 putative lipoprotein [Devosia lucknowensis]
MSRLLGALLALMVMLTTPVWADDVTLTGTVTYRERIALPSDAQLRVTLVTLDRAQPVVGAAARLAPKASVPVGFTLNVRSGVAHTGIAYGLLAEISSEGRVMFRAMQPVPVDLQTATPVEIVVSFSPDPPHDPPPTLPLPPAELVDQVWTVTSIGGRPVTGSTPLTFSVAADYRASGSAGCNNYFAEASIEDNAMSFGPAAATRKACEPALMEQERAYLAALAAIASLEHDGDSLRLKDAAGIPLIGLVRATE